jgi:hypothetical protein
MRLNHLNIIYIIIYTKMELTIKSQRVIEFYKNNPHINFEVMSIIMVELLEKLNNDLDKTINTGIQSQILAGINELNNHISHFSNNIELKMINIKKEYIQDMKEFLIGNTNTSNEKFNTSIKENNELLLLKTQNILSDIIPKSNEKFYRDLHQNISGIEEEIKKLSNNGINNDKLNTFLNSFDSMFQNIQSFTTGFSEVQLRIVDTKQEYIREMQTILSNENNLKSDKLNFFIQQNNDLLILKIKEWVSETKNTNNDEVKHIISTFEKTLHDDTSKIIELSNENNSKTDILNNFIHQNNELLIFKIKDLVSENKNTNNDEVKLVISTFEKTLHDDTSKIIELSKNENINSFINTFEEKVSKLFENNIQIPLKLKINSTEENIEKRIEGLKDSKTSQDKILTELEKFLGQYNKGSSYNIGEIGENRLETVLGHIYSSAIIKNMTGVPHSGDFIVKRNGFKDIMVETKEWKNTLDQNEVVKFVSDTKNLKLHSIFLSQTSGIAGKNNFQIDYEDDCICIYIHYVEYNTDKIKLAFDVIDSLDIKIDYLKKKYNDENEPEDEERQIVISKDILASINNEFKKFIDERESIINELNKNNKSIIERIKHLTFENLKDYLSSIYTEKAVEYIYCNFCGDYKKNKTISRAKQAIKAHEVNCCKNPSKNCNNNKNTDDISNIITSDEVIDFLINNDIVNKKTNKTNKNNKLKNNK